MRPINDPFLLFNWSSRDAREPNLALLQPFGRDLASSREMTAALAEHLTEDQTYRIDHYLAKVSLAAVHASLVRWNADTPPAHIETL